MHVLKLKRALTWSTVGYSYAYTQHKSWHTVDAEIDVESAVATVTAGAGPIGRGGGLLSKFDERSCSLGLNVGAHGGFL